MTQQKGRCKMSATPRPWKLAEDGRTIEADFEGEQLTLLQGGHISWCSEPGAFEKTQRYRAMTKKAIGEAVRAVNTHDAAKAALESLINNNGTGAMEWAIVNAKAVLAQMEGGQS